jgi:hypothetical protein
MPNDDKNAKPIVLKPGLLVALRTQILGGITYERTDLDAPSAAGAEEDPERCEVSRWETTKIVADKAEYAAAQKARSRAASMVRAVCTQSAFGLLCSSTREEELERAFADAQALVEKFNAQARASRVVVHLLKGRIESSDAAAAKAIGAEVRELIEAMERGIRAADPAAIREAANRARQFGQMLDGETAARVSAAIAEARSAARAIVRRVEVDGESAALVVQELSRKAIDEARTAFLDLDDAPTELAPLAESASVRRVDLDDGDGSEDSLDAAAVQ